MEKQLSVEQSNNKRSESKLHAFYQAQMEVILSEKIQLLQSHVTEMEHKLTTERENDMEEAKKIHMKQCEELRDK